MSFNHPLTSLWTFNHCPRGWISNPILSSLQQSNSKVSYTILPKSTRNHLENIRTFMWKKPIFAPEFPFKTLGKISRGGPLSKYLPIMRKRMHHYQTRSANKYTLTRCRTERLHPSFSQVPVLLSTIHRLLDHIPTYILTFICNLYW